MGSEHDEVASRQEEVYVTLVGGGTLEVDGEAVGLSRGDVLSEDPIFRLRDDHRCGYVDQMFVRPAYRQQGVGAQLLEMCEGWFREQGIGHCLLHAAPRAVRFYARIGYQPNREMFKKL